MQNSKARTLLKPVSLSAVWTQHRRVHWGPLIVGGAPMLLLLSAVLVWYSSLAHVEVAGMTDLGLASVLPVSFFAAIALLTSGFCLALHQRSLRDSTLLLYIVMLIIMLYGTTAIVEEAPRFESTWKHFGIVDYIIEYGQVNHRINAFFNWPGFFVLAAFVTQATGMESLIGVAAWSHAFFNLLYLAPLFMILSSVTSDRRLIWLGAWFFYLTNWAAQDHFAPQAFAYFLYLSILGCLLTWFKVTGGQPTAVRSIIGRCSKLVPRSAPVLRFVTVQDEANRASTPLQRMGIIVIVVTLFAALAPSHQLTPIAVIFTVGLLVACGRVSPKGLLILMGVIAAAWMFYMAVPYWRGHLENHLVAVGQVEQNVNRSIGGRVKGSPEHIFVVQMRMVLTVAVCGLAVLGGIQRLRRGYWDLTLALLVIAPPLLITTQGYGGEMMIRVYMFMLPGLVFFAAALFYSTPRRQVTWWTSMSIFLVSTALFGGFLFARFGNERMDYFTAQEVEAVQYVYDTAEPKSLVIAGAGSLPWKFQDPTKFQHGGLGGSVIRNHDLDTLKERMVDVRDSDREAYVVITRSTKATSDLYRGLGAGALDRFEDAMAASCKFQIYFRNDDATVFSLADGPCNEVPRVVRGGRLVP